MSEAVCSDGAYVTTVDNIVRVRTLPDGAQAEDVVVTGWPGDPPNELRLRWTDGRTLVVEAPEGTQIQKHTARDFGVDVQLLSRTRMPEAAK